MLLKDEWHIRKVIAYVNVMEEQIIKDIAESLKSRKLIKRTALEIQDLKWDEYGNDGVTGRLGKRRICLKKFSLQQEQDAPSSPVFGTKRSRRKSNVSLV